MSVVPRLPALGRSRLAGRRHRANQITLVQEVRAERNDCCPGLTPDATTTPLAEFHDAHRREAHLP
jgi:hypothetical protein